MSDGQSNLMEARIEAYKNLVGARTTLALSGDREQELLALQAANELKEKIEEDHDVD